MENKPMEKEIREAFEMLANQLSPENLCCDGELNRAQVQVRLSNIRKQWKALEKRVGRKVSQEEIEGITGL